MGLGTDDLPAGLDRLFLVKRMYLIFGKTRLNIFVILLKMSRIICQTEIDGGDEEG
jgi:hypothetical protein